jgi:hypothetical protein
MPLEKEPVCLFIHVALYQDTVFVIFIYGWQFDALGIYV